ncbi:MAG: hypothetical protein ACLP0J_21085 [Solirubrobacteraceae bacterium]
MTVGDAPVDARLQALLAATREALVDRGHPQKLLLFPTASGRA